MWSVGTDNNLYFRSFFGEEYVNHYIRVIRSLTKKALKKFTFKTGGKTGDVLHQALLQLMEPGQICFLPWFHCQEDLIEIFKHHMPFGIRGNILEAICKQHLIKRLIWTVPYWPTDLYILFGWYPKDLNSEKSLNSTEKCLE